MTKNTIITGGTSGLGLRIAEKFLTMGWNVLITGRDKKKLDLALTSLDHLKNDSILIGLQSDVSNERQNQNLVKEALKIFESIDVLVNNAGVYGPFGETADHNWKEWKNSININLFGPIYLTSLIAAHQKTKKYGKIIQISGGGATSPLPGVSAYAVSKAAIVRYMETLSQELNEFNIDVNCVAPGALNTPFLDNFLKNAKGKVPKEFYNKQLSVKEGGGVSPDLGADLCVFLASELSNGITGKLISAQWDNYTIWPENIDLLKDSDLYTLRRIVGKDRNFTIGDK